MHRTRAGRGEGVPKTRPGGGRRVVAFSVVCPAPLSSPSDQYGDRRSSWSWYALAFLFGLTVHLFPLLNCAAFHTVRRNRPGAATPSSRGELVGETAAPGGRLDASRVLESAGPALRHARGLTYIAPDKARSDMRHEHVFLGRQHARNERRTWLVVALTAAMMRVEIAAGVAFGSMALIADGLHMSTHTAALAIAALAYLFARRYARDPRFSFGTGKLGELAGFASAIILAVIAALIGVECVARIWSPVPISFDQAIVVAVVGLAVNLASAWLLRDHHHAHHGHDHGGHGHHHDHARGHTDHNLRSAYMHVLADALTSVLAIAGLLIARFYGWLWIDRRWASLERSSSVSGHGA